MFFFKQKTAYELRISDWSSDVCSSDLPESYYLDARSWAAAGMPTRAFLHAHNTLAGRLLLGPARCLWLFYKGEIARLLRGDTRHAAAWALHAAGVALVLLWVIAVCGLPLWQYLLLFVYPGIALSLVRSFLEHQARRSEEHTSELQSLMRISYAVFCLKKKKSKQTD